MQQDTGTDMYVDAPGLSAELQQYTCVPGLMPWFSAFTETHPYIKDVD